MDLIAEVTQGTATVLQVVCVTRGVYVTETQHAPGRGATDGEGILIDAENLPIIIAALEKAKRQLTVLSPSAGG